MKNWFRVGKIVNTQGIHGEVRIIATTDFPDERFAIGSTLYIDHQILRDKLAVTITSHRKHKNFDIVKFEGYPNINDVEKFKGGELFVSEDALGELEEGEYYYHEIIGCTVITDEGEELGKVKEVLSPGANDVWVIQRKGEKDVLIPYIDDVVKEVNIPEKRIIIHLLEGLI